MKEEDEKKNFNEDETEEINVEDLTNVHGGIDDMVENPGCGLGCFLGSGNGGGDNPEE